MLSITNSGLFSGKLWNVCVCVCAGSGNLISIESLCGSRSQQEHVSTGFQTSKPKSTLRSVGRSSWIPIALWGYLCPEGWKMLWQRDFCNKRLIIKVINHRTFTILSYATEQNLIFCNLDEIAFNQLYSVSTLLKIFITHSKANIILATCACASFSISVITCVQQSSTVTIFVDWLLTAVSFNST